MISLHKLPKITHLQEKLYQRILLLGIEVLLLISGLLLYRTSTMSGKIECRLSKIAMICKSTRGEHARRKSLC